MQAQALLWKISKPGHLTTYLMGTIHITNEQLRHVNDTVWACLHQCQKLALETDLHQAGNTAMEQFAMKKTTMKDLLSNEDYHLLDSILQKKLHVGLAFFNSLKPIFFSGLLLTPLPQQNIAMDILLMQHADSMHLPVMGMETLEEQGKAINSISLKKQLADLMEILHATDNVNPLDTLTGMYYRQDIMGMAEQIQHSEEYTPQLIDRRNKKFARHIYKMSKNESVFFAVGAGHMEGKHGVLPLLRKKHYATTPISIY